MKNFLTKALLILFVFFARGGYILYAQEKVGTFDYNTKTYVYFNENNFPDACFRDFIRTSTEFKFGSNIEVINGDSCILLSALQSKTGDMKVSNYQINGTGAKSPQSVKSLKGIEYFTSLTGLHLGWYEKGEDCLKYLEELDISACTQMTYLDISVCASLDWDKVKLPPSLVTLKMRALACKNISITSSNLTTILAKDCEKVETITLNCDGLTEVNFSKAIALTKFDASGCTNFNGKFQFDNCTSEANRKAEIILPNVACGEKNTNAIDLILNWNGKQQSVFENITITNAIKTLNCSGSQALTSLNFKKGLENCSDPYTGSLTEVIANNCPNLTEVILPDECPLNKINVSDCPLLETIYMGNTSAGSALTVDIHNTPKVKTLDLSSCSNLISLNTNADEKTKTITLNGNVKQTVQNTSSLTTVIFPSSCNLTSWSAENNKMLKLTDGTITFNNITSNGLSLNFNNCDQIQHIDFSNVPKLTELRGKMVNLEELDIEKYADCLKVLSISGNKKMKTFKFPDEFDVLEEFTATQINGSSQDYITVKSKANAVKVNVSGNGYKTIDVSNCNLTSFTCDNNGITDRFQLKFPEDVSILTYLSCSNNSAMSQLPDVVAQAINLETIKADNCGLAAIDVSKNTLLKTLSVKSNKLLNLDLDANTILETLDASSNKLTEVPAKNKEKLKNLNVGKNYIENIPLDKLPALQTLDVSSNKIIELNGEDMGEVTEIIISNNNFLTFDASSCEKLKKLTAKNCPLLYELKIAAKAPMTSLNIIGCKINALNLTTYQNNIKETYTDGGVSKIRTQAYYNENYINQNYKENLLYIDEKFMIPIASDFEVSKVKSPKINDNAITISDENIKTDDDGKKFLILGNVSDDLRNAQFTYTYETGSNGSGGANAVAVTINLIPVTAWTGAKDTDWDNAENWTLGVPNTEMPAFVYNATNLPVIKNGETKEILAIYMFENSKVTVMPQATLAIKSNDGSEANCKLVTADNSRIILKADSKRVASGQIYSPFMSTELNTINQKANITIERQFRYKSFERFSMPIDNLTSNDFCAYEKGSFNKYLYRYDETMYLAESTNYYKQLSEQEEDVKVYEVQNLLGNAWVIMQAGQTAPKVPLELGVGYNFGSWPAKKEDKIMSFSGTTKNEAQVLNLTWTENDDKLMEGKLSGFNLDGWNMVGNPFPCTIDWTKLEIAGLEGTAYIYDPLTGVYYTCNRDGITNSAFDGDGNIVDVSSDINPRYILPTQAFLVRADGKETSMPKIQFKRNALSYENNKSLLKKQSQEFQIVRLAVANEDNKDLTVVYFREGASKNFDSQYDSRKMLNGNLDFYAIENQGIYSINALDSKTDSTIVNLGFSTSKQGKYTISAVDFNINGEAFLIDSTENKVVNITEDNYTFETETGTFEKRFYLVFSNLNPAPEVVEPEVVETENNIPEVVEENVIDNQLSNDTEIAENIETIENKEIEESLQSDFISSVEDNSKNILNTLPKIWPNPAREILHIANFAEKDYKIINNVGKIVKQGRLTEEYINISNLPSGMYIIKIGNLTTKFIKK